MKDIKIEHKIMFPELEEIKIKIQKRPLINLKLKAEKIPKNWVLNGLKYPKLPIYV